MLRIKSAPRQVQEQRYHLMEIDRVKKYRAFPFLYSIKTLVFHDMMIGMCWMIQVQEMFYG